MKCPLCDSKLEILSTSPAHESIKTETYCESCDSLIDIFTQKGEMKK